MIKELSPATEAFIYEHAEANVQTLALQASRHPGIDMPAAITQIAARQKARTKLPFWWNTRGIIYPQQLSMEQCSSEVTARYKASLIPASLKDGKMTDLSGGFGIDFCCMAPRFQEATYVERQKQLCQLAQHNFPLLHLPHAQIIHADSIDYLQTMAPQNVLFIDPARRDMQGRKTVAISDCEPDIRKIYHLLADKSELTIIKYSPMLDITQAVQELKDTQEIHVVAVHGECKELLIILKPGKQQPADIRISCVNLPANPDEPWPAPFNFTIQEEEKCPCILATNISNYLYEPHAAILKAGAFRTIAQRYHMQKLHINSHLYTSSQWIEEFPGRCFEVISHGGFSKSEIKELLSKVPKANLTIRNFPSTVSELRKKLKLAEGGDDYLFATTLANEEKAWILCRKASLKEKNLIHKP